MEGEYISLDTAKKLAKAKAKALLPEGVEAVVISKDDYDRLSGELTKENIELKLEIERLNNTINELEKWLRFFNENGLVIDLEEGKQTTVMPTLAVIEKLQELKGESNEEN